MRKLDHGPAAPKIARPSIHPNPSSRFRRTSIAPPTDDSQITQHRIPTLKSDRLLEHWSDVAHISWEKNIFLRGGRDGYPADGFRDVEVHRVKLLEWHRGYIVPTAVADALKEDSSVVPFRQPQTLATRHHRKGTRPPGPYYETLKTLLTENRDRLRGMPIGKICTLMRDRLGLRKAKNIPRSNTHLAAMIHRALDEIDTEDEATS